MEKVCIIRTFLVYTIFRDERTVVTAHLHVRHRDHAFTTRAHSLPVNTCSTSYVVSANYLLIHDAFLQDMNSMLRIEQVWGLMKGSHQSLFCCCVLDTLHDQQERCSRMLQQQQAWCLTPAWPLSSDKRTSADNTSTQNQVSPAIAFRQRGTLYSSQHKTYLKHLRGSMCTHVL